MQNVVTNLESHVVHPESLSAEDKDRLTDELYAAHSTIFDGVSRADFTAYVVDSTADRTRIEVFRDRGEVVGYLAVHTFVREVDGERWVILRAESGKLPAYRRATSANLMIREGLRACLLHPFAKKAYLGCFVHPSAYLAMSHVAPELFPHWEKPTPKKVQALMEELATEFHLDRVDPGCAAVRKVGWITRQSEHDRLRLEQREDAPARFYLSENPGYVEGHGLLTMVPIRLGLVLEGAARYLRRRLEKARAKRAQENKKRLSSSATSVHCMALK